MRLIAALFIYVFGVHASHASPDTDRLLDAMGIPSLMQAFSVDGQVAGEAINKAFLNGQGGDVWAETVRRMYDPARLELEMRSAMAATVDRDTALQAALFFESELGQRVVDLETQARRAMQSPELEAVARAAPSGRSAQLSGFLTIRDLVERNTKASLTAQAAFYDGMALTSGQPDIRPDFKTQYDEIEAETESWLRGYFALAQSPLSQDEVAIYTAFWDTDVGRTLDDALFAAFADSYKTLSFGLGQAVGRLLPQNDL